MTAHAIEPLGQGSEEASIARQKRLALAYLSEAWDGALAEGVDSEIVAHVALFTALADLISVYGEDAVAELAKGLPKRVQALEFSVDRSVQ
ncbi:MAG: hypothetical protein WD036_09935 [Bauldia sp.]